MADQNKSVAYNAWQKYNASELIANQDQRLLQFHISLNDDQLLIFIGCGNVKMCVSDVVLSLTSLSMTRRVWSTVNVNIYLSISLSNMPVLFITKAEKRKDLLR